MPDIERKAIVTWNGDSRTGHGRITTGSGALKGSAFTYTTRFGEEPGTSPEELIAAAHAACFSMAFASALARQNHIPDEITTTATCFLRPVAQAGYVISKILLETRASVPDLDLERIREIAQAAECGCPVSKALRPGVEIELLVQE